MTIVFEKFYLFWVAMNIYGHWKADLEMAFFVCFTLTRKVCTNKFVSFLPFPLFDFLAGGGAPNSESESELAFPFPAPFFFSGVSFFTIASNSSSLER